MMGVNGYKVCVYSVSRGYVGNGKPKSRRDIIKNNGVSGVVLVLTNGSTAKQQAYLFQRDEKDPSRIWGGRPFIREGAVDLEVMAESTRKDVSHDHDISGLFSNYPEIGAGVDWLAGYLMSTFGTTQPEEYHTKGMRKQAAMATETAKTLNRRRSSTTKYVKKRGSTRRLKKSERKGR